MEPPVRSRVGVYEIILAEPGVRPPDTLMSLPVGSRWRPDEVTASLGTGGPPPLAESWTARDGASVVATSEASS